MCLGSSSSICIEKGTAILRGLAFSVYDFVDPLLRGTSLLGSIILMVGRNSWNWRILKCELANASSSV